MTTRLLVLHPEDDRVRLVDGELPVADDPFPADVTVLRTLRRDGDDKIVLAEARDDRGTWGEHELIDLVHDGVPREPWQERGWLADAVRWIDEVNGGHQGDPVQLRHWGLSAVLRVGDVVLKEVPDGLGHEGEVTAALAREAPGSVPTVLAVEGNRFLMRAFDAEDRSLEPEGLLALGELQRSVTVDAPDRRLHHLPADAAVLTRDLLLEDRYELASTDTRRPPRPLVEDDFEALDALVAALPDAIDRFPAVSDTIVHGDFHVENVAWVNGRCLLLDWGMASVSHPFMDLLMWSQWAKTGEDAFDLYFEGWGLDVDWDVHRQVSHLFLAVTCARLSEAMTDPAHAYDWAAGAQRSVLRALATSPPTT